VGLAGREGLGYRPLGDSHSPDEYFTRFRFKDTLAAVKLVNWTPKRTMETTYHRVPGFDKCLLFADQRVPDRTTRSIRKPSQPWQRCPLHLGLCPLLDRGWLRHLAAQGIWPKDTFDRGPGQ
jgi:hypothetical protein